MNRKVKFVFVLFAPAMLLLFASSCKTTRSSLKKPLKEQGFDYLYAQMLENQLDFDYLNARFNIAYQKDKDKTDLRGQLRIRKDSLIWISLSPALGIEAARISLTDDSVKFINRLNKTYLTGQYEMLDTLIRTSIDYSIIEAMIIGSDLTQYDVGKFKASIDGGLYRITIQERRKIRKYMKRGEIDTKILVQNIWLDPESFKIRRIEIKELGDDSKKLEVFYEKYQPVSNHLFPSVIKIEIIAESKITIDINFGKTVLNEPLKFPFRISKKYARMY
ncbi:MAG: DUF4292 domain-containing protein [Bacteroidales bacterium]|nr:DUF4292 domain-containing protein [Bacteroidales bacterium]